MAKIFSMIIFINLFVVVSAIDRVYYIASLEVQWDYFPTDENMLPSLRNESWAYVNRSTNPPRIGQIYRKAVYREYTDETFTVLKERPGWMGLIGPLIKMETGDRAIIHFKNMANRNYSLHAHGVRYSKANEGAYYNNGTDGVAKEDDIVVPGANYTYIWNVPENAGPTPSDSNCLVWAYHAHRYAVLEISTGIIGTMLICKPGTLDAVGDRLDVDREFSVVFQILDENDSLYLRENILSLLPNATDAEIDAIIADEGFKRSNRMHAINGFIYGSLPNLTVCVNETIAWYFVGLGNTFDLHSMNFEGLSLDFHHRRKSSVAVFPADFLSATMVADGPLKTLLVCDVYHHFKAGLMALLKVEMCEDKQSERIPDELLVPTRTYYISAEEIVWDYGPTGINQFSEQPLDTDEEASYFFSKENNTIGGKYLKAVYHEYTDSTFEVVAPKDDNLGILGPVIYAEVGDLVEVVFKNSLDIIASINPQGILVQGSHMLTDPLEVQGVVPGDIVTYMWPISVNIGPLEWDPPCISRIYVSAVDPKHVFAGLVGPIVICKKGQLDTLRQSQIGIDREFFMLFAIFNENLSPYLDKNIAKFCENPEEVDKTREHFKESNKKYAINGYMFGNCPGLSVCVGETIVWHILGIGNTNDLHVAHFHGNTFQIDNSNKDTISVIPGVTRTLTMTVDNPGDWPIDCGTTTNFVSGMRAIMSAEMCFERINSALPTIKNKERVYYIGAVEEVWNYSPGLMHPINGFNLTVDINGHLFVVRDDTHIGSTYKKVFYREFTDETFSIQKPSAPGLGLLGPIIKAEVGDTLRIKFKNMAMRNYSFYAHGMMYNAPRAEPFEDLGVAPGQVYEYVMDIPDRSGPGSGDFNCTTWSYFSAVDPIKDPMSGLIGILVTCRSGILNAEGMRTDVQREFAVLFAIIEESLSWYLDENIQTYCGKPSEVHKDDEDFKFSNRMHSTNGYIYDNLPGLEMMNGDRVAFYLLGFGDHLNIHTIHFHGESFWHRDIEGNRVDDVTNVYPDTTSTVELIADSPGKWLLHCHVNDHIRYGMVASYIIHPRS